MSQDPSTPSEQEPTGLEGAGEQAEDTQRGFDDPLDELDREAEGAPDHVQESDVVAPEDGEAHQAPSG